MLSILKFYFQASSCEVFGMTMTVQWEAFIVRMGEFVPGCTDFC